MYRTFHYHYEAAQTSNTIICVKPPTPFPRLSYNPYNRQLLVPKPNLPHRTHPLLTSHPHPTNQTT
jgi:hypothetical protein